MTRQRVRRDSPEATARAIATLEAYAESGSVEDAAKRLGVTPATVRHRLHELYRDYGFRSGPQAIWKLFVEREEAA